MKYQTMRIDHLNHLYIETSVGEVRFTVNGDALVVEPVLSEKKPRTKVEYIKSDVGSRGQALDAFDNEIELFEFIGDKYKKVTTESDAISKWRNLYERIETPMTEREAFVEALQELWIIDGVDGQEQMDKIFDSGLFKLVN